MIRLLTLAPPCARCLGSGEVKATEWRECPACAGEGVVPV